MVEPVVSTHVAPPFPNTMLRAPAFSPSYTSNQEEPFARWTAHFNLYGHGSTLVHNPTELRALCRGGVPDRLRPMVWQVTSGALYKRVVEGTAYRSLLAQIGSMETQATIDIEKDLHRSFPEHPRYQTDEGVAALRNVLRCYAARNPLVGYAQGMNMICSLMLVYMSEDECFWLLSTVVEELVPGFYRRTLLGAILEQETFERLLGLQMPQLAQHFASCHFEIALVTQSWFLSLFVNVLPLEVTLRVLDAFFEEGSTLLLRVALALVKLQEERLYGMREAGEFLCAFQGLRPTAEEIFALVNSMAIPAQERLLEHKHEMKYAAVMRLRDKTRRTRIKSLGRLLPMFSEPELEVIYDRFYAFVRGGLNDLGVDFVSFQKLFPAFCSGWYHEMTMALFMHLDTAHHGWLTLEQFTAALSVLMKGETLQKFDLLWKIWDADADATLALPEFQHFVRSMCVVLFQHRSRRGINFCVPNRKILAFSSAVVGRDPADTITFEDARFELITRGRLERYFGGHNGDDIEGDDDAAHDFVLLDPQLP